jgi:hypothetical protein
VTVLVQSGDLDTRRIVAREGLLSLADSLERDLEPVLSRELFIPPEKARMTRRGGRCENDGTLLEFDPFSPRVHRCLTCGATFDDESHYRWWVMGYQLWLAERAVHSAALFALQGNDRHRDFARAVLDAYADRYLAYPNKDNVLGPARLFFSTYLESIWLLQLVVALDLLELAGPPNVEAGFGGRVRERIIEPSARLIASYDEGMSNRQVWNNAALLAASRSLHGRLDEAALAGSSGLVAHLTSGLLEDGTWYEGENYHLFAHRGLWYGVSVATAAGATLNTALVRRFDEAFATPFVTALPDFTFPSRRDSQYRVSLRQWRFAELAELGLVRQPADDRLLGALATLYDGKTERRDTGRSRSTAEAERNTPATALARSDLGWRSLLFAAGTLPPLLPYEPRSALLPAQGLAILRRDHGSLYAALDYGHSGAGHGHPDRLNFLLVHGDDRWLDDVGTGSYVDPSLHWYRSTLAHNAPLVNGRSQLRVHGQLVAYEDRGDVGWVRASVDEVAPGVRLERTIVAMSSYLIDELTWRSENDVTIDLPIHVDGDLVGAGSWSPADPQGGTALEDGFDFLADVETASSTSSVRLDARLNETVARAWVSVDRPHAWWRATAVGPPGRPRARFYFLRTTGQSGRVVCLWALDASVTATSTMGRETRVSLRDGSEHVHESTPTSWRVALTARGSTTTIDLSGGAAGTPRVTSARRLDVAPVRISAGGAATFELGEAQYRRSEQDWAEAGKPSATVAVGVENDQLVVVVNVKKQQLHYAAPESSNPLDNEHPDTNSDGIQLHLVLPPTGADSTHERTVDWLIVPESEPSRLRASARATGGIAPTLDASWSRTPSAYEIRCAVDLADLGLSANRPFRLGVVVNDMTPDRERRRGQLVLGGKPGEFVYLRGDRLSADEQLVFVIDDA